MGYLRAAKVGLVTPVRDGMNLVAKEFVAAQDPADPGVLVLSTLAGAARELTTALLVNPYDATGVAEALQTALWMPLAQRQERFEAMMNVVRTNDIHAWNQHFIEALIAAPGNAGSLVWPVEAGRQPRALMQPGSGAEGRSPQ
jgi:trehalose 6-phosphate synthase